MLDQVSLLKLQELLPLVLYFVVIAVPDNEGQILEQVLARLASLLHVAAVDLLLMLLFDYVRQVMLNGLFAVLYLHIVGFLQAFGVLAFCVIEVSVGLIGHYWVLVRHLVTSQHIHQLQLPVVVHRDVDVELRLQGEVLLLVCRHVAPDDVYQRVVELKVHWQAFLAQVSRDEYLLVLLYV